MVKNVNHTARLQWKADTIKNCKYLQCADDSSVHLSAIQLLQPNLTSSIYKELEYTNLLSSDLFMARLLELHAFTQSFMWTTIYPSMPSLNNALSSVFIMEPKVKIEKTVGKVSFNETFLSILFYKKSLKHANYMNYYNYI